MGFEWNYAKDSAPVGYERGEWDGKRSDLVLAVDSNNEPHIARIYEGNDFTDWVDKDDNELNNIVKWAEIPYV